MASRKYTEMIYAYESLEISREIKKKWSKAMKYIYYSPKKFNTLAI